MSKSAAQIANDLSKRDSKNKKIAKVDEEVITGGLTDEVEEEVVAPTVAATPFDLVEGRPNVDFWGPFDTYNFVTTPHGEFGIPNGKLLRFEYRKEWDKKEGTEVMRAYPQYEDAPQALMDYVQPLEVA